MLQRFLMACFCVLISACAGHRFDSSLDNPDWEIAGKIGIRETGGSSSSSLFQWRQKNDHFAIYLINSLGQTQLTIIGNKRKAIAQQANGKTTSAKNAEDLLLDLTGWYFPISSAKYWLQGQTQSEAEQQTYTIDGHLNSFTYQNWQVRLDNYHNTQGATLPHKLLLRQNKLAITLIIKQHAQFNP
jgi:outer membrane lipoprotein LolB